MSTPSPAVDVPTATRSFCITHLETTPTFTLYHLDGTKRGYSKIVYFHDDPVDLQPVLGPLHRNHTRFDFEIEPLHPNPDADPRLATACRLRALTLFPR